MRNQIIKITALTMLVALCMWQIVTLWLGDMSSHNFLGKNNREHHMILVQPKSMWVNIGSFIYKADENKNVYRRLIEELINLITSDVKSSKIEKDNDVTYEELLSIPGIFYEYAMGFGVQELAGIKMDGIDENMIVNQVFVDMSSYNDYATNLYLVSEDINSIYKVTLYNRLEEHQKVIETFNKTESTDNLISYQPSITSTQKQNIKGNSFMPSNTKKAPIEYEVLQVSNLLEEKTQEEKIAALEVYVNSFFSNPLLKEKEEKNDGSIVFSEKMRASVTYMPIGTLEFNITSANEETKLTEVERLTKVMTFIKECTGIPEFLKEGIYVSKVVNRNEEYIYQFDYKYKGFSLVLNKEVKEKLGLESILQITVKNNQVVGGKWSILNIDVLDETTPRRETVSRGFDEIVNTMLDKIYIKNGHQTTQLDVIECKYVMDNIEGIIKLDWTVFYQNTWYLSIKS